MNWDGWTDETEHAEVTQGGIIGEKNISHNETKNGDARDWVKERWHEKFYYLM